ncbi:hypothetical protein [Pseudolysinimonas sp.]
MTLLHPARAGSPLTVWFVDGVPSRLVSGGTRFRVVGEPRCADINGTRYWRVRARGDEGGSGIFDLRETGEGWVLAGVEQPDGD